MPHEITSKAKKIKKIVVVGAGPAGLEAARVCAERGHNVVVFEATNSAGGQINLICKSNRRKDMIGIVDWRLEICKKFNVKIFYDCLASSENILSEKPDVIIIATGGTPNTEILEEGSDLVSSTWDVISGSVSIQDDIILYDDNGSYPGLQAAEIIANKGSKLEIISPERFFSPEIGGMNYVPYAKNFIEKNVKITINKRIKGIKKRDNRLVVTINSDYSDKIETKEISQVIVEHGTIPVDDLYFNLKKNSFNGGALDYKSLINQKFKEIINNPKGSYYLYRVGDSISSRNIHSAIYDSLRICKNI
tara:strand:- start:89 stop:1006 length:918 start_codon:yes stop_codon:yes gene_type:complete